MADKVKELEQRIDRLETKLKSTFLEVEKRFEQRQEGAPISIEERLQEFEDLILLMQLEITKLKEKNSAELDFGAKLSPDVEERLRKLEENAAQSHMMIMQPQTHAPVVQPLRIQENKADKPNMDKELDDLERRLKHIEEERTSSSGVLEDVKRILNA